MKKAAVLLGGLALVFGLAFGAAAEEAKKEAPPKPYAVGDVVKSFDAIDLAEKSVKVTPEGNPTAITFFNSSCSACRAEMVLLKKLTRKEKDLKVIAVCTDAAGVAGVERFKKMTKIDEFEYYVDPEFKAAQRFGFSYTPALVLLDSDNKIYMSKGGFMNADEAALVKAVSDKGN